MPNLPVDVDSWGRSACYPRSTFYPLSDGHTTLCRRITRTWFPTCSACGPRSQACLCSCTRDRGCRPRRADLTCASVTLWEATAPVKLPTWHGPCAGSRPQVRMPRRRGWYSKGDSAGAGAPASRSPTYPLHGAPAANAKLQ